MRRITRKKLKQDEFISAVDKFIGWLTDHWKPVAAVSAAAVVLLLAGWGVAELRRGRAEKISRLAFKAVEHWQTAKDEQERQKALKELEAVASEYPTHPSADPARLLLAKILAEDRHQLEQAKQMLRQIAQRGGDSPQVRMATLDLIHMRVASGEGEEVERELRRMVAGTDKRLPRDVALFELARTLEAEGKFSEAKEHYQKLVEEFPESPLARDASLKLRELG